MKTLVVMFAVLSGVFWGGVALAQDPEWNCANPQAQQEMNYCAALDFEEADRALNVAWGIVYAEIKERDQNNPPEYQGWGDALLSAQRAWLGYRDGQCEAEGFQARGGTLEPLLVSTCKTHMTKERTQELLLLIETY